jgi:putative membrane protein
MRWVTVLLAAAGSAVIAVLVVHFGAGAVARSLAAVGISGVVLICAIHLLLMAMMGLAWWVLLPGSGPWPVIWARLVRDSVAEVLPFSQLGGYVFGARALAVAGVPGGAAVATTIVDVTQEFLAQIAYVAIALSWLVARNPRSSLALPGAIGTGLAVAGALAFVVAQRRGFGLLERALGRGWTAKTAAAAASVHAAIAATYARRRRVAASFGLHLIAWIASAGEIWLALKLMGAGRSFGVVVAIESLLYAIRSLAFMAPNALGVQEGAYVVLGMSFGLGPETTLALSLLKRARDFAIGLPVLGAYHLVETGRLWRVAGELPESAGAAQKPRPMRPGF